jgi:uridine phosphorylase
MAAAPSRRCNCAPTTLRFLLALVHDVRPNHLRPAAELAERVLLPGDPARALAVAQALLDPPPRMFNHARGLWGYTGTASDGELLTVQATGMGGPSAAIVCEELIALGAITLVRIGTCDALDPAIPLGTLLAAESVLPADGTSAALGADAPLEPDPGLLKRLVEAGARPVTVASSDLFYDPRADAAAEWADQGAVAVEMEAATILQVAARRGVAAACVLGVTDVPAMAQAAGGARGASMPSSNGTGRLSPHDLTELGVRIGQAGYAAVRSP